jgi:hypothetical protein
MNFTDRCAIATACLPRAEYRTKLEQLHAEMLAAIAVQALPHEPDNAPVAWQWLKSGTFRVNLPRTAERGAWRPLYAALKEQP